MDQRDAQLCSLKTEFQHIAEYWNGGDNYNAMNDALHHIGEVAEAAALTLTAPCQHGAHLSALEKVAEAAREICKGHNSRNPNPLWLCVCPLCAALKSVEGL